MGYDAIINLPQRAVPEDVVNLLNSMGFITFELNDDYWESEDTEGLYYFQKLSRPYDGGRQALLVKLYRKGTKLKISTRLNIACSYHDMQFNNEVISLLSGLYGCSFQTDHGRNTLFTNDKIDRRGAESICYNAYQNLESSLKNIEWHIANIPESSFPRMPDNMRLYEIETMNPEIFFPNVMTTHLIAIIEEYLRETFKGILMYSPEKRSVFKDVRIKNEDLLLVSDENMDIHDVVVRWISFQNLSEVHRYFKRLRIDVGASLGKAKRGRESAWDILKKLIEQRHDLIHSNVLNIDYNINSFNSDLTLIETGLRQIYKDIFDQMQWRPEGY